MANIPFKSITFPGLPNKYTVPEISSDLMTAGKAADAKATGDALSALEDQFTEETDKLKADLDAIDPFFDVRDGYEQCDVSGIVRYSDYKIGSTGTYATGNGSSILVYAVTESGTYRITPSVTSQYKARIYSAGSSLSDILSTNVVKSIDPEDTSTRITETEVEAGQYIVTTAWSSNYTLQIEKYVQVEALSRTIGLTEQMGTEVDEKLETATDSFDAVITQKAQAIKCEKWLPIIGEWERGFFNGYNSISNTSLNRARCKNILQFDRDTYLLASSGFYICGYFEDGTSIDRETTVFVSAGRKCTIYTRRITENSSESADIETFSNAVKYSTPDSDMERLQYTFTDVSMFERVGICGDSYAAGGSIISGVKPLTWGKNLERQAGITVELFARSGQSVVGWMTDTQTGFPALAEAEECGLYWMQHGINGTSTAEALGTAEDITANPKPETFYGQYANAVESVQATYPNARIILASVIGSSWEHGQLSMQSVNTAIETIATHYGVPFVDITQDDFFKSTWYADYIRSAHPTAMQAAGMAMAYRRLIAKCIMDNPQYFLNYGNRYDPVN